MGKTRDLFRKIRDTKGTFHAKMSSIKDRNGINLNRNRRHKKRWQEYTEELYNKYLHDPDNHNGVITHLEPDILECEVKWALGSITTNNASGGDGIPVELFQILKDDAVKVLHSIYQQIWKMQQWPQDWKRSVFIPIPKKGNAKECSNYYTSFPGGSEVKASACNVGDLGSIPGLGRSPGEGNGNPLQYSGLENSIDCIDHLLGPEIAQLEFHLLY